jgi:hypothetical protein
VTNPLMTPPRERVVLLYPGDAEAQIAELREQIPALAAEEDGERAVPPGRLTDKAPSLKAAAEIDRLTADARERAVKVTMREVPQRVVDQLRDEHPPRPENERDKMLGLDEDGFYWALVRKSIVDPVVTDAQWAEFVESASMARRKLLVDTAEELSTKDVSLPKSSAVSALQRIRGSALKQPDDTE